MRKSISKAVASRVKLKFEGRCGYCGTIPKKLHIDHMIPIARELKNSFPNFDHNAESNLMPACPPCNNYKNVLSVDGFREEVGRQVERARRFSVNFRTAERFGFIKIQQPPTIYFYFELRKMQEKS